MSGVRSSWPASAANRRVACRARSIAVVEARRRASISLSARASERTSTGPSSSGSGVLRSAAPLTRAAPGAQARERADRERREAPRGERGDGERGEADEQHEAPEAVGARLDRSEARQQLQPRRRPRRRRAPTVSERHSWPSIRTVAKPSPAGTGGGFGGHVAALLHDLAVERHLGERAAADEQALGPAAARRPQPGPPNAVAVAAAGPGAMRATRARQVVVDRGATVALDGGDERRPGHRAGERDGEHRGDRDPRPQARRQPHGRSTQPIAAHGVQHPRLAVRLELAADVADEHVDDVRLDVGGVAPDLGEQLLAREHLPGMTGEDLEQLELAARGLERAAAAGHDVAARVDDRGRRRRAAPAPSLPRRRRSALQPRGELGEGERLDEVVVGAGLQPGDAVLRPRRARRGCRRGRRRRRRASGARR